MSTPPPQVTSAHLPSFPLRQIARSRAPPTAYTDPPPACLLPEHLFCSLIMPLYLYTPPPVYITTCLPPTCLPIALPPLRVLQQTHSTLPEHSHLFRLLYLLALYLTTSFTCLKNVYTSTLLSKRLPHPFL